MNNPTDNTKKEQKKEVEIIQTKGRFFSEADILTREAKINFTLNGLPLGDISTTYGNGGVGKGYFILNLLTDKNNFLYHKPLKICYLTFEDSIDSFTVRYQHQKKAFPTDIHDVEILDCIGLDLFQLTSTKEKVVNQQLMREVFDRKDFDLLILDTWAMASWQFEENSNSDLTQAMSKLKKVARDYKCSFMLVHHTNKSALNAANSTNEGALRGASSIIGNSRLIVSVSKVVDDSGEKFKDDEIIAKMEKVNFIKPEEQEYFRTGHGILQIKKNNPLSKF